MREMKEIAIPFCKYIPKEWQVLQNRYLFSSHSIKVGENYNKYQLLSLTTNGVKEKDINASGGKVPTSYNNYQTVTSGDMIFCLFDLDCSAVFSGLSPFDGMITSAYDVFRLEEKYIDKHYIEYWFQYVFSYRYYKMYSKSIRYTITSDMFKSIETPVPPLCEQKKIGAYLDSRCSQIDALIANVQKQIERLKAYKQSIITETVTKGLDKNAPMKNSGVEWIGDIPESAELTKVSHLFTVILGKMVSPAKTKSDETLESYFCAANVHFDNLQYDELKTMWFDSNEKETYIVQKGDLLVVEGGAGAGGSHIVEKEISNCYIQNSVMIVRRKKHVSEKWLYYMLYMLVKNNYIDYVCNKATIPNFTKDKLNNTPVIFYNEKQMQIIIAYLDRKCAQIDKLIALKQQKIQKLQQYKKSLIYEYVTGKKEI